MRRRAPAGRSRISSAPQAGGSRGAQGRDSGLALGLVFGGILSVQLGAAIATTLFDELGAAGTVLYRLLFSALVLAAIWRPSLARGKRSPIRTALLFGVCLGAMNLCAYEALDRIPLGIAVTFAFLGPLAVAIGGSRRALDLIWVALAATGILLLAGPGGSGVDVLGVVFATVAGALWGAYILISARLGQVYQDGAGLAIALVVATILVLPVGVSAGGTALLEPQLAVVGLAVGLLSSAIPYSLELEALRRIPPATFGVILSLEPAVAAGVGLVVLGQGLNTLEAAGVAFVVAASAGALREPRVSAPVEI